VTVLVEPPDVGPIFTTNFSRKYVAEGVIIVKKCPKFGSFGDE